MQNLSTHVIYNHLASGIATGDLSVKEVVELADSEIQLIEQEILQSKSVNGQALKPVYDALGGLYELAIIRCVNMGLEHQS
jgi:ATP-dependent DNA helicase RecQ